MKFIIEFKRQYLWFVFMIFFSSTIFGQAGSLKHVPYRFDAGGAASQEMKNFTNINPGDSYTIERGYGWTLAPEYSFYQKKLSLTTMRDELTVDGVTNKELEFRIDLPAGAWWFTFWMEAGNDYKNTAELFLNNNKKEINWHALKPGESGENVKMPVYRVYHSKINVSEDGFTYKLVGSKDSIRICGFTFIPENNPKTKKQEDFDILLKYAGKYRSKTSLNDLHRYLSLQLEQNPHDAYWAYWHQQTGLLREGERLKEMMGWEWARNITKLSIFDRLKQSIALFDGLLENYNSTESALYEKALWYRSKIFYDLFLESGGKNRNTAAQRDLKILNEIYPDDPILMMLNGAKIDFPDPADNMQFSDKAPKWSILQRELYNRLSNEIDWWVNERQAGNGELGGKIGDDVELLRWWSAFLLTDNKTAIRGWRKLADAVWYSPKVYNGYSKRVADVEHAAEFISDSTPELILIDEDSTYFNRLYYTASYQLDPSPLNASS